MIEKNILSDKRHDDFYERFMERRIQMFSDLDPFVRNDSIPLPIALLNPTSTAVAPKWISDTNTDSGGKSPLALSPIQPSTQLSSPQRTPPPIPPTSQRMPTIHPPARSLIPIQQFMQDSWQFRSIKPGNKEPKINRCQPDHPDSQSVLRTRTRQGYKI